MGKATNFTRLPADEAALLEVEVRRLAQGAVERYEATGWKPAVFCWKGVFTLSLRKDLLPMAGIEGAWVHFMPSRIVTTNEKGVRIDAEWCAFMTRGQTWFSFPASAADPRGVEAALVGMREALEVSGVEIPAGPTVMHPTPTA